MEKTCVDLIVYINSKNLRHSQISLIKVFPLSQKLEDFSRIVELRHKEKALMQEAQHLKDTISDESRLRSQALAQLTRQALAAKGVTLIDGLPAPRIQLP